MSRTNNILLKIELKDSDIKNIIDSSNNKKLKSIKVKIEATHSGKINKNFWFYTPKGMMDGAQSFVKPYNKPVTVNHDPHADPLGRVLESKYISYDNYQTPLHTMDISDSKKILTSIKKWIKSSDFKDTSYKGLGHIELIAEITDQEAIQKIIDKRYLTVSIGGGSDVAICSICGTNKKTNYCDHYRGETYKDEVCFYVSGTMEFDHISYVSSPADLAAISEVIEDSVGIATLEILDYEIDKGSQNMKLTIKQLREKFAKYTDFVEYMDSIGLSKYTSQKLCDEAKEISFIFSDERIIPIFDKAHYVAARTFISENLEDSADKEAIITMLEDQAESMIGNTSIEDALKELADDVNSNDEKSGIIAGSLGDIKVNLTDESSSKLVDSISSSILDKLKETFTVSDSFASQRMRALQRDNSALSDSLSSLEDKYKSLVISSIIKLADNKSDEYKAKLLSRNISSLEDQLNDLVDNANKLEDNVNNTDKDDKQLETGVTKDDASHKIVDDNGKLEDNASDTSKEESNATISLSEIRDTYKEKVRTEGLRSAKAWFKQITDEGKVPSNFTFN